LQHWLTALDSYTIAIEQIQTAADGDVGMAWGFYREEFQTRGGVRETHRGRFSEVMKCDAKGWRTLFYHRDATPFDSRGVYAPLSPS